MYEFEFSSSFLVSLTFAKETVCIKKKSEGAMAREECFRPGISEPDGDKRVGLDTTLWLSKSFWKKT